MYSFVEGQNMSSMLYMIKENDNVATALEALSPGTYNIWLESRGVAGKLEVGSSVPKWFKVATKDIAIGQNIVKFGYPIGTASVKISKGTIVHRCNLVFDNYEQIAKDPLIIENRFEIGKSTDLILEKTVIEVGRNAVLKKKLEKRLKGEKANAQTNIPADNILYCGNLLETEVCRLGPHQVKKMVADYALHMKKMEEEANDLDFKMFSRHIYTTLRFYRMLKGDFSLSEIKPGKKGGIEVEP